MRTMSTVFMQRGPQIQLSSAVTEMYAAVITKFNRITNRFEIRMKIK